MAEMRSKIRYRGVENGFCHALHTQRAGEGGGSERQDAGRGEGGQLFQLVHAEVGLSKRGGYFPGLWNVVGLEPGEDLVLAVRGLERLRLGSIGLSIGLGTKGHRGTGLADPLDVGVGGALVEAEGTQAELV